MAEFLASLNLGAQTAASSNNPLCDSVEDLRLRLRRVLDTKATPNRAEHISITMEMGATVQFHLPWAEQEDGALEGSNNIDPSLSGYLQSDEQSPAQQGSRDVEAKEALMNQPQTKPVLQTMISKHIITALGAIDGSDWITQDISREAQGWTFTYMCRNSDQVWSRQHAKHLSKSIVGEYSQREPDPILSARPAFDCRGSVVITFNRNSRRLSVKYNHTLIHKTVAELLEHFKPPSRRPSQGMQTQLQQKASQQKTPKKKADKRAQDEMGPARKKKRKAIEANQSITAGAIVTFSEGVEANHDASVMHLDPALVPPAVAPHSNQHQLLQTQEGDYNAGQDISDTHSFDDNPKVLVGGGRSGSTLSTRGPQERQPTPAVPLQVKITQTEAKRRRDAAMALLTGAGVPPNSLSIDQFGIFSNQSPHLQRESLRMLVKYGAEKLCIVHPSAKEQSASSQANVSPTPSQVNQITSSQPTTYDKLVPQSGGPSNEGYSNEGPTESTAVDGQTPTTDRGKMGKSRNACFQCKIYKTKCPRERPVCSACEVRGVACEYAPQKPRKRPPNIKSYKESETRSDGVGAEAYEPNHNGSTQFDESYALYDQMPVSDIVASAEEMNGLPDSYSHNQNLIFVAHYNRSELSQHDISQNTMQTHDTTVPVHTRNVERRPIPVMTEATSAQNNWQNGFGARSPQSQLSEPAHHETENDTTMKNGVSSDENIPATHNGQVSQCSNHYIPPASLQGLNGMQQASSLPQPAAKRRHRQSPTPASALLGHASSSSDQAANTPLVKSPLGQRRQSKTPSGDISMSGGYQPPLTSNQHAGTNNSSTQSQAQMGEMLRQGDDRSYGTVTATHQQEGERSGYETFSQAQAISSVPETAGSPTQHVSPEMSLPSQTPSATTLYRSSTSDPWLGPSGRHEESYGSTLNFNSQDIHVQSPPKPTPQARQRQSLRRGTRPFGSGHTIDQQQPNHLPYSLQEQQHHNHRDEQQSSWYNFDIQNSNNSFTGANHHPRYHWSGV